MCKNGHCLRFIGHLSNRFLVLGFGFNFLRLSCFGYRLESEKMNGYRSASGVFKPRSNTKSLSRLIENLSLFKTH